MPAIAALVLIAIVAVLAMAQQFRLERRLAGARLEAVAALRASHAQVWFDRQMKVASFVETSISLADRYRRWQAAPDDVTRGDLRDRAREVATSLDAQEFAVVDAAGTVQVSAWPAGGTNLAEITLRAVREAIAGRHAVATGFYRDPELDTALRMDLVVPLLRTGPTPLGAIVVRADPERTLFPLLDARPLPSRTARTRLWEIAGGHMTRVDRETLPASTEALTAREATKPVSDDLATSRRFVARVARGEASRGRVSREVDAEGIAVLAVAEPVPGADWWLVTRMDLAEVDAPAWRSAWLIATVALLGMLGIVLSGWLQLQRRRAARDRRTLEAQTERLESLAILEAISQSTEDAIYATDLQGRYIFCNDQASRFLGLDRSRIIGATNEELFEAGVAARMSALDRQAMVEPQPDLYETLVTEANTAHVHTRKRPLRGPSGQSIGMFGMSRDVSSTRRMERALRDSERHYESVVAVLTEGIIVYGANGDILSHNASAARIFESDAPPADGDANAEWVVLREDGSTLPMAETPLGRVLGGAPLQRDVLLRMRSPGGAQRFIRVTAAPLLDGDAGTLKSVVVSITDVTEREQMQVDLARHREHLEQLVLARTQALQQVNQQLSLSRDEADSANRAKSAFLANMSHEIRTPMNAIIGLTHIMSREAREPRLLDRLDKVATAAQHLLGLIDDVLDLSKIEAGKLRLEDIEFPFDEVLSRATGMVQARAAAKGLELMVDVGEVPARLRGDPLRLSQILINLLTNAVKFTDHGWVRLHGRVAEDHADRVCLRFEVEDTGPGLSPPQQAALFTAFQQADNSITRRHGGTGLGLALSRQLARAMDGDMGVVSMQGAGSTFWFTACLARVDVPAASVLPVAAPPASDTEALLRARHRGQRVLLAEDNPVNREVAQELLAAAGLVVETAWDGRRAVDMALQDDFDLVLMDMQMPEMDGLDASRAIRARLGPKPPIIAMTANAFLDDRQACLAAGMDDHLAKPVVPEMLFSMLLRWLPAAPASSPATQRARPLSERLAGIPGFDMQAALRSVGGQTNALKRVLRLFSKTYHDGLPALLETAGPEPQGFTNWRAACHSARGALDAIGARDLAADMLRFEGRLPAASSRVGLLDESRSLHQRIEALSAEIERQIAA